MVWVDRQKSARVFPFRWKFSTLGRRFVLATLLATHFLAAVATAAQVWALKHAEDARLAELIVRINTEFIPQLTGTDDTAALLTRLSALADVGWAELASTEPSGSEEFTFELPDGAHLVVQPVRTNLITAAENLFVNNLLRTLLTGMLMLIIFDRIAARHLKHIASQVRSLHWMDTTRPLERDAGVFPDEFNSIVDSLESMRAQAQNAYASLSDQAAKMRALNQSLQRANREQRELTYAMTHDLIAPVNTLDMLLEDIVEYAPDLTDDTRETLSDMHTSARRMRGQIESVQTYGRLLQGRLETSEVDLDAVLHDVCAALRDEIRDAQAILRLDRLGKIPGHANYLKDLFREVLRNALRYRDPLRQLTVDVKLATELRAGLINLEIVDTGQGIPAHQQEAVFALFKRLHTQADVPGFGMGLPIARRIAELHGGDLRLHSTPGTGSTFTLTLSRAATS